MLRHGHGRQHDSGGRPARPPLSRRLPPPLPHRGCFVNYVDPWPADAVLERSADAMPRTDAVLAMLRQRMSKPQRWGAVVMRQVPHHP